MDTLYCQECMKYPAIYCVDWVQHGNRMGYIIVCEECSLIAKLKGETIRTLLTIVENTPEFEKETSSISSLVIKFTYPKDLVTTIAKFSSYRKLKRIVGNKLYEYTPKDPRFGDFDKAITLL